MRDYSFVRNLTDREIRDELAGDPPREEYPRSEAYLAALRTERDRRLSAMVERDRRWSR